MRYMMMIKATKDYEEGHPPSPELMVAMGKLSEEMMQAGKLLSSGGLQPSARGTRLSWRRLLRPRCATPTEMESTSSRPERVSCGSEATA